MQTDSLIYSRHVLCSAWKTLFTFCQASFGENNNPTMWTLSQYYFHQPITNLTPNFIITIPPQTPLPVSRLVTLTTPPSTRRSTTSWGTAATWCQSPVTTRQCLTTRCMLTTRTASTNQPSPTWRLCMCTCVGWRSPSWREAPCRWERERGIDGGVGLGSREKEMRKTFKNV